MCLGGTGAHLDSSDPSGIQCLTTLNRPATCSGLHLSFWWHISLWSLQRSPQRTLPCNGIQITFSNVGQKVQVQPRKTASKWRNILKQKIARVFGLFKCCQRGILTALSGIMPAHWLGRSCDQLRKDQSDYETQQQDVGRHLGLTLFLDRLQRDCTWLHIFNWAAPWPHSPSWKCQEPAKQGKGNKLGQGYREKEHVFSALRMWRKRKRESEKVFIFPATASIKR